MLVLGIETSCDETGVALYCTDKGLIADALYSQIELHQTYGGVVPELASRDHVRKLVPLTRQVCAQAGVSLQAIQGVAYTAGPGLIGALMSGACFARSLAFGLGVPVLGVHHLEGHLLAPMLDQTAPEFPFVALLVSGGHTQLIKVAAVGEYQLLGESLDDAAGEAFDKTAKLLGLGYPGGPAIAKLALQGQADRFKLPRPMVDRPGLDFSFSGLKTAVLTQVKRLLQEQNLAVVTELDAQTLADLARAFQDAVVDTLVIKCKRALQQTGLQCLVIAGGVSANQELRHRLDKTLRGMGAEVIYPALAYCTDNGAMIAYAGAQRLLAGQAESWQELNLRPRWPLTELRGLN